MSEVYYKIRNRVTDTFSTGGTSPRFSPEGKTWGSARAVSSHLRQANFYERHPERKNLEIVETRIVKDNPLVVIRTGQPLSSWPDNRKANDTK